MRYKALLGEISQFGIHFAPPNQVSFETNLPTTPLLRHDVDFSTFGLESMGELECQLGHRAIYLFRPDARSYNFESAESSRIIQKLNSMGHEIGLHIDRRSHFATSNDRESIIKYLDYVKSKLKIDVSFLSWHRPLETDLGNSELFYGLQSLYSNQYWNRDIYLSDSAGNWDATKESKMLALLRKKVYFQLLIHPEWWLGADAVSGFAHSYSSQLKEDIRDLRTQIRTFDDFNLEQKILDFL